MLLRLLLTAVVWAGGAVGQAAPAAPRAGKVHPGEGSWGDVQASGGPMNGDPGFGLASGVQS